VIRFEGDLRGLDLNQRPLTVSTRRLPSRPLPIKDSLTSAAALVHGLTVVTRNTRDFRKARVKVLDPFH